MNILSYATVSRLLRSLPETSRCRLQDVYNEQIIKKVKVKTD